MDLSLKQRLLGAAVLIALAVIFVPMFISGSGPGKGEEMQTSGLAIPPAPDREFQSRVLPVDPAPTPTIPPADDSRIATVDTATAPKPEPLPPPTIVEPAASKPSTATPSPAAKPAAPVTEAPKLVPGQAANGRFFVHLGVYTATRNAQDLVASLKKDGFPAFDEGTQYQGKPASRVRVGPFSDRAAAEAARLRIKQARPAVPGSVVQLAADAPAAAPAASATAAPAPVALPKNKAGSFVVQLGALKTVDDANKLRDRVKNAGFPSFVDKVDSNGTTLWRVRVGPEVDRASADKLRTGIKDKLKLDGIVVTQ